jgi:hypothetical protein
MRWDVDGDHRMTLRSLQRILVAQRFCEKQIYELPGTMKLTSLATWIGLGLLPIMIGCTSSANTQNSTPSPSPLASSTVAPNAPASPSPTNPDLTAELYAKIIPGMTLEQVTNLLGRHANEMDNTNDFGAGPVRTVSRTWGNALEKSITVTFQTKPKMADLKVTTKLSSGL